jgi:hypothetical protein
MICHQLIDPIETAAAQSAFAVRLSESNFDQPDPLGNELFCAPNAGRQIRCQISSLLI